MADDAPIAWSPDAATRTFASDPTAPPADLPFLLAGGQAFGPYRIVRAIGKGGMGQAYEAEEIESGRRVALKLLTRGIGDPEEREQFLREGRIAASLSHPNLVYVFGTSEIQGLPVIAMELAPAGTLKDLADTPLGPSAAVDAILQVVAGLDAAASAGILHRDIKPSNCFVASDGRVLVGDFGLSIASAGRAEHGGNGGIIAGTPGFASPEQLRGEALDVRSDIYSVGATLYYLLTGRAPIEAADLGTLITRVSSEAPPSPDVVRAGIPKGLAAIVSRCLSPVPSRRFASYAALGAAVEPYRSGTVRPAGLIRRTVAGIVDTYVSALPVTPINITVGAQALRTGGAVPLLSVPAILVTIGYYGLLEGYFGAAAGKALLGLRVLDRAGARPGFRRALSRAAIFELPSQVLIQIVNYWVLRHGGEEGAGTAASLAVVAIGVVTLAVLFSTARRRNGHAGLHDLASGTRVVMHQRAVEARGEAAQRRAPDLAVGGTSRIGPYIVGEQALADSAISAPIRVGGYDDRLHRPVWIVRLPPGTPALAALRRDLARPGRARWLAGRRTATACWDAFEAIPGRSLRDVARTPQPWSRVRHWVADLAHELVAGTADGSLPSLDLERVWIGEDGRARLLDLTPSGPPPVLASCCRFLYDSAMLALLGDGRSQSGDAVGVALPLAGRELLLALGGPGYGSADALAASVDRVLRTPARVSRGTRAGQLGLCLVLPLVIPALALYAVGVISRLSDVDPRLIDLQFSLERLADTEVPQAQREALELHVAGPLRPTAEDPTTWTRPFPALGSNPGRRALARRILAAHPAPTAAELARSHGVAREFLDTQRAQFGEVRKPETRRRLMVVAGTYALLATALLGLFWAFVLRGGLTLRALGSALVTTDGASVSRTRALLRAAIAWSPVLAMAVGTQLTHAFPPATGAGVALRVAAFALLALGGLFAAVYPARGLQDRVAGTSVVPR